MGPSGWLTTLVVVIIEVWWLSGWFLDVGGGHNSHC